MRIYVEPEVDAEKAKEWLKLEAPYNRPEQPGTTQDYARDIANGDWYLNGDTIKFDENGRLFDGGHRLRAIIMATETLGQHISIPLCVAVDADPRAYMVTDIGRKRNAATMAHALTNGVYSGKSMPMVRWFWQYQMGNKMGRAGRWAATPTRVQELELFQSDPNGFENSWERGKDLQKQHIGNKNVGALFHHLLVKHPNLGQDYADDFIDKLISGTNLPSRSAIKALRDRLMTNRKTNAGMQAVVKYAPHEQLYLYHRAFWSFGTDEPTDSVNLPAWQGGMNNSKFPELWYPGIDTAKLGLNPKTGNKLGLKKGKSA